jgi:hypothetical protein
VIYRGDQPNLGVVGHLDSDDPAEVDGVLIVEEAV